MSAPLDRQVEGVLASAGLLSGELVLAFSGGVDSCVLLHILAGLAERHPIHLRAVHVNHGISPHAADWARFCRQRCAELGVPCEVVEVRIERAAGESLEAAARHARHAVLRLQRGDAVVLAHHLDDQAETVMLQLLRGSGVPGLAAMPQRRDQGPAAPPWVRPLLETPRARILAWAREADLRWVEDESNACDDFDRNFLRQDVLPRLGARFAGYRETLARAARNLAEANELLEALARQDAGEDEDGDSLSIPVLRGLGDVRARNLLRWFVARHGVRAPSRERLEQGLRQLLDAEPDRQPRVTLEGGALRRFEDRVEFVPDLPTVPEGWRQPWRGERAVDLPFALGRVRFDPVRGTGLQRAALAEQAAVGLRLGGERLQLAPGRPRRPLKDMLREARLAPWQRQRLPLLFVGDALAWAPGLGWDCRFAAAAGEEGLLPSWQPALEDAGPPGATD